MKRAVVLTALVVLGALSTAAQQPAPAPTPAASALQIEKINDNLYLIRGGGRTLRVAGVDYPNAGNTAAFITANGVVLVDTKLPGWGSAILEKLKEVTDKPVTTIINTHTHFDHVSGNVDFSPTVEVIAHESTAKLMQEMRPVSVGVQQPNVFKDSNGRGLPKRTFTDRLTIGGGSDRIELHYFGRAHTGGDTWVVFPALRAMHSGDAFANKAIPPIDINNGGSGIEYPQTLAKAIASLPNVDTIITGHYQSTLTMADLKTYADFMREFVEDVQSAKKAGRSIDHFVKTWTLPERYAKAGYTMEWTKYRPLRWDVEAIWNETK